MDIKFISNILWASIAHQCRLDAVLRVLSVGRISSDPSNPVLPFFSAPLRHHPMLHPTSILHDLFKSFDHLDITFKLDEVSLPNLLYFPLNSMFQNVPQDNWLHRYPRLAASTFFVLDPSNHRLRLKVEHEYTILPRLFKRLYKDILERRMAKL
ncbi:hypothetical protein G6F43_011181 [Rhizopus delemar]|nr:hypothetical protein G6F43_011181 [Rhizopus delemar]